MFFGGGGPSTEDVMQEEFKKQKEFIEKQFKDQQIFMKKLMTDAQLEAVQSRAFGVLDALESRYEFITAYEGMTTCLSEDVINQVTLRVEYFMDESHAESIKHAFDNLCPEVLESGEKADSQTICGLLTYTYLIIETKRHEILTVMLSLLADSEKYEELTMGYLKVKTFQKKRLTKWLGNRFGSEDPKTYCGLFVYHRAIWQQKQLDETIAIIHRLAPKVKDQQYKCERGKVLRNKRYMSFHLQLIFRLFPFVQY